MPQPAEYVTDVPYARTFHKQLAPSTLRLVAALGGFAPPPADDFDYCELGSASGDTLVTMAAANPAARFVGVDLSPEHVAVARDLAASGGVDNVRFVTADFEALPGEELAPFELFDFIGAHGVLSWVSAKKWQAVVAFAKARLKPGGIFYASYDALPGWASIEPVRRLMLEHTAQLQGSTLDSARVGLEYAKRLADGGAAFFANHPTARSMLALAGQAGLPYVVHEYFHAHFRPMYFADVARELRESGLTYAGRLPLHLNIRELAVPPGLQEMARGIQERVAFETFVDYAQAEMLRSDVYVKTDAAPSDDARRDFFAGTPFGTVTSASLVSRSVRLPVYTLDFTGALYDALIPAIAEGAAPASELVTRPKLEPFGAERVSLGLQNLAVGVQAVPMRRASKRVAAPRYAIPLAHNRAAIARSLESEVPLVLASPQTGSGVTVSLLDAACLHLLANLEPSKRKPWVRAFAAERKLPLPGAGEDLVAAVLRELDAFTSKLAPKLAELGILEPA
jgi:SAM-dependent methyltransferase